MHRQNPAMTVAHPWLRRGALATALVMACTCEATDNSGSFMLKGKTFPMTAVYAEATITEVGSGIVLFTDKPEAARFEESEQKERGDFASQLEFRIQRRGAHVVALKILSNFEAMLWTCGNSCQEPLVFDEKTIHLSIDRYDDQRIEGHVNSADPRKPMSADRSFSLDLHNGDQRSAP
ncbi:MAG: hypothetical protein ABI411_10205 [Tahibacter sp.]